MTLAKRLIEARKKAGLTQTDLAEKVGIKQQSILQIEDGRTKKPRYIEKIAVALGVSASWLLFGQEDGVTYSLNIKVNEWGNFSKASIAKKQFSENYIALKVQDDSMCTTVMGKLCFNPGTIAIVEPTKEAVIDKYFIIRHIETGTVLFRQLKNLGTTKRFMPINPIADNCLLEEAEIIGVVVASINLDL